MGVNRTDVGEMGQAQKNMNAPQWVQGLRMCSNYRFNLQSLEKETAHTNPSQWLRQECDIPVGVKKDKTLRKALGAFSGHVSKVDVSRGAAKGRSRPNNSITPDSAKPPSDSAACHWTGPVTGRKTKRPLVVATNTPGASRPSALRVG